MKKTPGDLSGIFAAAAAEGRVPLILGPMAGVTDRPFRRLCHEAGADLVCMEMVSANAIKYGSRKTEELLVIDPEERPVSLQLFGSDPETMARAAAHVAGRPFDVLDINMGCPVPKVVKNGEGSALMKDPDLCGRIVAACKAETDRPVTVKIRSGFTKETINAPEVAQACEAAGAAMIAVHARTREQLYEGRADWGVIRAVAEAVKIPVIGNGDVGSADDAARLVRETGCSGVMIARAARGNPWIFRRIRQEFAQCASAGYSGADGIYPKGKESSCGPETVPLDELCDMMLRHAAMQTEEKGEHLGVLQMRSHLSWYAAGRPFATDFRAAVNQAKTLNELTRLIERFREENRKREEQHS